MMYVCMNSQTIDNSYYVIRPEGGVSEKVTDLVGLISDITAARHEVPSIHALVFSVFQNVIELLLLKGRADIRDHRLSVSFDLLKKASRHF